MILAVLSHVVPEKNVHIAHACLFVLFAFCVTLLEISQPNVQHMRENQAPRRKGNIIQKEVPHSKRNDGS